MQRPRPEAGSAPAWESLSRLAAAVLAAVVIVALGVAVLFRVLDRGESGSQQQDLQRARADAVATADAFALAMDDVDGAKFGQYMAKVNRLLTTKARTKNTQGLRVLRQVYERGKVHGTGKVLLSGVSEGDLDSATVLVFHDSRVSSTAGTVQHHYRWTVDLVKVGNRWLVDDFTQTSEGGPQ